MATYTVVKGDTLGGIALRYSTTVNELVRINNIKNPNFIVVGQVLKLDDTTPDPPPSPIQPAQPGVPYNGRPSISLFGVQSNTQKTYYVTWEWNYSNTKEYQYIWYYYTGDGVWFVGSESTTQYKQALYTPPDNAISIRFRVKAISETYTANDTQVNYWTCDWSTDVERNIDTVVTAPGAPSVALDKYKLTATLDNLTVNGDGIEFEVYQDNSIRYAFGITKIITGHASFTCNIVLGHEYKVRCRTALGLLRSEWSEYSSNISTIPNSPQPINVLRALTLTEIVISWHLVPSADNYEIEYTTDRNYFDTSDRTYTKTVSGDVDHAEISGLETGQIYFFRVRATNQQGNSQWTDIRSLAIGKKHAAPTTWSSTTTAIAGEPINLYWVHNAEDGSSETYAQLELSIQIGDAPEIITIREIKNSDDEEERDKTRVYTINTTGSYNTTYRWRVRTKGVIDEYGEWSTQRSVTIYEPPTLTMQVTDVNDNVINTITEFPFYIKCHPAPEFQTAIGYYINIIANESYETIDPMGNVKMVQQGNSVYSKYFNADGDLELLLSAGDIDLKNNISYTIQGTVSMNSGLTANQNYNFTVSWESLMYEPNAGISYDPDTYSVNINPYCLDKDGNFLDNVMFSIYRINYDGSFTEIVSDITDNYTFVVDPHPTLNFARYRIVMTSTQTGSINYFDLPPYPINEPAIIIQWDEVWRNFDTSDQQALEDKPWTGSLVRLPYNIDVTDENSPDVALVNYIGRENPVSYYGTQLGIKSTWNTDIPAYDNETVYALRRLSRYMGDVYVREPSGIGYWANVTVSFSKTHNELVIPVTLNINKVEGGI